MPDLSPTNPLYKYAAMLLNKRPAGVTSVEYKS